MDEQKIRQIVVWWMIGYYGETDDEPGFEVCEKDGRDELLAQIGDEWFAIAVDVKKVGRTPEYRLLFDPEE